jgi:putative flippase GtrA
VGLASTVVTLGIIYLLMVFGVPLLVANFLGYAVGVVLNFRLNANLTFGKKPDLPSFGKFLLACLVAYLANLVAVMLVVACLPERIYLSQLVGMVFYTGSNFLLNRFWVMR